MIVVQCNTVTPPDGESTAPPSDRSDRSSGHMTSDRSVSISSNLSTNHRSDPLHILGSIPDYSTCSGAVASYRVRGGVATSTRVRGTAGSEVSPSGPSPAAEDPTGT